MTTRPTVGRQPPQRSLSSTNAVPKPPPHRTLSQQYTASSPTRRGNESFTDLTLDGDAQGRPKLGMSRLRVEISTDSKNTDMVEPPRLAVDTASTWKPGLPPRGRPQLH